MLSYLNGLHISPPGFFTPIAEAQFHSFFFF